MRVCSIVLCCQFLILILSITIGHAEKEKLSPQNANLLTACYKGRLEMAIEALRHGADIEVRDGKEGNTPLMFAIRHGHLHMIKMLLEYGANMEALSLDGEKTPMLMAAYSGNADVVRELLQRGASGEVANERGDTPLLLACYSGQLAVVRLLLARGVDMNKKSIKQGFSGLYIAASAGYGHVVEELLRQSDAIDVDIRNHLGRTPLHAAIEHQHIDCMRMLIEAGASVELKDFGKKNSLFLAIKHNCKLCVQVLISAGNVNVNSRESGTKFTPLMRAASLGYSEIMDLLINMGMADVHVTVSSGSNNRKNSVSAKKSNADSDRTGVENPATDSDLVNDLVNVVGQENMNRPGSQKIEMTFIDDSTDGLGNAPKKSFTKTVSVDTIREFVATSSENIKDESVGHNSIPETDSDMKKSESISEEFEVLSALSLSTKYKCKKCVELLEKHTTCSA